MAIGIKITPPENLSLRDPQASKLGCRIIKNSIILIDELGFEAFTFKKLAKEIGSTEASVYRYFENKHQLLLYLLAWYWQWVNFLIDINTMNVECAKRRMDIIVETLVDAKRENPSIDYVNETILHRIIIAEGSKAYHTKMVDQENTAGLFQNLKDLNQKVADTILECNPEFSFPNALASTLFEMANNQLFFAEHLPKLTNICIKDGDYRELKEMMSMFVHSIIGTKVV